MLQLGLTSFFCSFFRTISQKADPDRVSLFFYSVSAGAAFLSAVCPAGQQNRRTFQLSGERRISALPPSTCVTGICTGTTSSGLSSVLTA